MQYQGGKSRIAKSIAEVIDFEVSGWKIENSTRYCNRALFNGGGLAW